MGCDGGTIPRRDEMVKLKKKAEKADKDVELSAKWKHCALSCEKLKQPIVACELGRLYNKEALLLALLDKSNLPEVVSHVRSWKDVTELQLTPNTGYTASDKADRYNDTQAAEYVCPVTGLEMSGRYRFSFIRGCGCVISEKALKEAPSETCHKCGRPFTSADIVVINGSEEDEKKQRETIEERRKKAKLAKRKRKAEAVETASSSQTETEGGSPPTEKKIKLHSEAEATGSTNATGGVEGSEEQQPASSLATPGPAAITATKDPSPSESSDVVKVERGKGEGTRPNGGLKKGGGGRGKTAAKYNGMRQQTTPLTSKLGAGTMATSVVKKATKEVNAFKTVAEDPAARSTYKSLFNSGNEARPKEITSNWVTFFPYH